MADHPLSSTAFRSHLTQTPADSDDISLQSNASGVAPLDFSAVSQVVLRLKDFSYPNRPLNQISEEVAIALYPLITVLDQLRSPHSGWPDDVPQTAENLLPYVAEETDDVIEALQSVVPASHPQSSVDQRIELVCDSVQPFRQDYCFVGDLAPWWLWGMARSAHDVMHLMEGVRAWVKPAVGLKQCGILRLAVVLNLEIPHLSGSLDLATTHSPQSFLTAEDEVILEDSQLCQAPTLSKDFLQTLTEQIQFTTPLLGEFLDGVAVDALVPQQGWQSGLIQLQMKLEFMPDQALAADPLESLESQAASAESLTSSLPQESILAEVLALVKQSVEAAGSLTEVGQKSEANAAANAETISEIHDDLTNLPSPDASRDLSTAFASETLSPQTVIRFPQLQWVENYRAIAIRHHVAQSALQIPAFSNLSGHHLGSETDSEALSQAVIMGAGAIANHLKSAWSLSSRDFLQAEISLDEIVQRLRWCLSHSSYEVMQLMGGLRVSLLKPSEVWETGTLRLWVTLNCSASDHTLQLDLATGQPPKFPAPAVALAAIAQSSQLPWQQPLSSVERLKQKVIQQVQQATPEVLHWLEAVPVEYATHPGQWQPAVVQLGVNFEFVPDAHLFD